MCVTLHSANVGHSALNCEAATAAQGYSTRDELFNALTAVKTLPKVSACVVCAKH